jgi:hypothetical protein
MLSENSHLTDQDLLLAADGELPGGRLAEVRAHLSACWDCRSRMAAIEKTIADFARAYRHEADSKFPPIDGSRALLKAQLAQLAAQPGAGQSRRSFRFGATFQRFAYGCAVLLVVAVFGKFFMERSIAMRNERFAAEVRRDVVPDPKLTPGITRAVALRDVCSAEREEVVRDVPTPVRHEVFQEYGIANARANDYEIDYLIAPGLGGADDVRNLWPEPHNSGAWNSRVKDDLEEQLHEMVCTGKLDLPTAQRDIATDWIAAYKKYFHTDRPLPMSSNLTGYPPSDEIAVPTTDATRPGNRDVSN